MKVKELIEKLQEYNPEARVVHSRTVVYSEYTSGDEPFEINAIVCWPYTDKKTATSIELCEQ